MTGSELNIRADLLAMTRGQPQQWHEPVTNVERVMELVLSGRDIAVVSKSELRMALSQAPVVVVVWSICLVASGRHGSGVAGPSTISQTFVFIVYYKKK